MQHGSRFALVGAILSCALLGACASIPGDELTTGSIPPADARPSDENVAMGRKHYRRGDYGLAERYFRKAVEANPKSAPAWLGLAASYDRLKRFELASRAYEQTIKLQGRTPQVLNNLAYHYMLRGNTKLARRLLEEAERQDPGNAYIEGNLGLLATWSTGERPPGLQDEIIHGRHGSRHPADDI